MHINDWASNAGAQYGALAHSLLNGRLDLEKDPPAAMAELENPLRHRRPAGRRADDYQRNARPRRLRSY